MSDALVSDVRLVLLGTGTSAGVPVIGDRVFIGPNAVLYGPIRIGDDAMVGANSVVNKDVPAGTLAVGCPAIVKPLAGEPEPR